MRGALELQGIRRVDAEVGNRTVAVHYTPAAVTVEAMLEALQKAGEPAQLRQ